MPSSSRVVTRIQDQDDAPALGAPQDGQGLVWNNTTGKFVAAPLGGGAVDSVFGRTGAVVAESGDYNAAQVGVTGGIYSGETVESALDLIDGTFQVASDKLTAINSLTWAANSIIQLTGTATTAVVTLASHVWTFLQSATAADARSAIGAAALGANTFTGTQNLADNLLTRPVIKDYGETVNALGNVTGTMTIDLENGNYVTATLTGAVTVLAINNWPATGTLGSITLELSPAGNTVVWTGVTWVGDEPTLGSTVNFVVLWSRTAGSTIYAAHTGVTA